MDDKLAVLVHGYTLVAQSDATGSEDIGSREWNHVVWGNSACQMLGRVTKGVLLALKHRAKILILGTGASCIFENNPISFKKWVSLGKPSNVLWEAEYAYNKLISNFNMLYNFKEVENVILSFGGLDKAQSYIERISTKDIQSRNTEEEVRNALKVCNEKGIETLISVSNLSHVPRCTAIALKEMNKMKYNNYFLPSPCSSDFADDNEALIFEPQSGPGPKQVLHPCNILKKYFYLSEELKSKFLEECKDFFDENLSNADS